MGVRRHSYYLTATGWVLSADMGANYTVSYESDGTAIFDQENTDFSLKFSAAELDVSGKPIKDYLGYESHCSWRTRSPAIRYSRAARRSTR